MTGQQNGAGAANTDAVTETTATQAASSSTTSVPRPRDSREDIRPRFVIPEITDETSTLTAALAYADAGGYVLPVNPTTRIPLLKEWQKRSSRDREQIFEWFIGTDSALALHVGRSGLVVFDVDRPERMPTLLAEAIEACQPPFHATRDEHGGRGHYLFMVPEGRMLGNSRGQLFDVGTDPALKSRGWGEVRGHNGFIIVAPSEHAKGGHYHWERGGVVPLLTDGLSEALPEGTEAAEVATDATVARFMATHTKATRPWVLSRILERFHRECSTGSRHEAGMAAVCAAMRDARRGYCAASVAREELLAAFTAVMSVDPSTASRPVLAEFHNMVAYAVGQAEAEDLTALHERSEGPVAEAPEDEPPLPLEERGLMLSDSAPVELASTEQHAEAHEWLDAVTEDQAPTRPPMRERVLSLSGLRSLPPVEPLVEGLLYRNTLAQVSGPPGEYKTFITLGMALCVALGLKFEEHRVPAAGPVVYVAAEGSTGLLARVLAWCHLNGVDPEALEGRFYVLPEPVQIGNRTDVTDAVEFAAEIGAALIVLDTRARCTIGLEENSATEQGTAIAGAERIQRASGATVLVVHHSGRSGEHGRGSTAWDGAVWSDLRVSGGDLRATITCAKHKDVPDSCKHTFELKPVVVPAALMPEADEQARSTLVVVQATPWTTSTLDGKNARIVQKIVWTMAPPNGLPPGQLRDLAMDEGASRSGAYAAVTALVTSGFLRNVGTDKQPRYITDQPAPPGVETTA